MTPLADRLDTAALQDRLTNWGNCQRARRARQHLGSKEADFRNTWAQRYTWHPERGNDGRVIGWAPNLAALRRSLDPVDAAIIETAWQTLPSAFHQFLLCAWYVRAWSEGKALAEAWAFVGEPRQRRRTDRTIAPHLTLAEKMLALQLAQPAVIRRPRLVARIHAALGLDDAPATPAARPVDTAYAGGV